ncbi:phosphoadenosine phosphosulfate reductase family protein [Candidatus Roizmanbacteria bacterium]|nr:phosphoadenosine phosphosulfate reductase family protein [Candidatus Roizmanbacteria bacterium]
MLNQKIKKAHQIIKEAVKKYPKESIAIAWTGGKDSTVVLHLVRKVFKGKVPFKLMFNDSTLEFPEVYDFVKKLTKKWKLDLIWQKHTQEDLESYKKTKNKEEKMEIMRIAKINAINYTISKYNIKAFISGIRLDEHEARSKETFFSKRATHDRVHPILEFTIKDIWAYIKKYKVPYVNLYDKGYKSLGERPFTKPVKDKNAPERAGREATKEKTMDRLRKLGYW